MNGSRPIGEVSVPVRYCGHSAWPAYTAKSGKQIQAGGAVTVREEWINKQTGAFEHRVTEYRIDSEADVAGLAALLLGLQCGEEITMTLVTYQSPRGTTWQNVAEVARVGAVESAKAK